MLDGGSLDLHEQFSSDPTAQVSGATSAWVQAFAPGTDASSLQFSGNRSLADLLIGQLSATALQDAHASVERQIA